MNRYKYKFLLSAVQFVILKTWGFCRAAAWSNVLQFFAITTEQFAWCHVMDITHNGAIKKTNPTYASFFGVRVSIIVYSCT